MSVRAMWEGDTLRGVDLGDRVVYRGTVRDWKRRQMVRMMSELTTIPFNKEAVSTYLRVDLVTGGAL